MIVVAFLLLGMGWMSNYDAIDSYKPGHHITDWAYFLVATYVYGAYRVARIAERPALRRMFYAQCGLVFAVLAVFLGYHAQHTTFEELEPTWRSPYHVQLAAPVFLGLFLAAGLTAVAARLERTDVRALAA